MNLHKKFAVKQLGELKTLELYLYGEIESDYYDFWTGKKVESTTSANYVRKAIEEAGNVDVINVYINSIGGDVGEGIAIYNILKRNSATVNVYIDAYAYSIASVIAMAGDKITMPSNTTMMIHNARMGCYGNSTELRKAADNLDVINEASCNSYLIKTAGKISKDELTKMLDSEIFLGAEKALEYGFADEISNPVDITESVEIIKQAQQRKNPNAKMAYDMLKKSQESEPTPPQEKADQTINKWFASLFE